MHKTYLLAPAIALLAITGLTACGDTTPTPKPTASTAATEAPSGQIQLGHSTDAPSSNSTAPSASQTAAADASNRDQAIKALDNAGSDWYANLGPDLKDKVYTKTSSAKLIPAGTIIKAKPTTWEPASDTEGDVVATFTYPGGRSMDYDVTMVKINGKWLINFTIMHMD